MVMHRSSMLKIVCKRFLFQAVMSCIATVQATDYLVETIALILLPVAVLMCAYALTVFIWRARAISKKQVRAACLAHMPTSLVITTAVLRQCQWQLVAMRFVLSVLPTLCMAASLCVGGCLRDQVAQHNLSTLYGPVLPSEAAGHRMSTPGACMHTHQSD